jgi:pilus assembly protein CpaB
MKPKTMILMIVAVTCGLGASYMTSRLLAERNTVDDSEKVSALVARKNLEMGYLIKNPAELFEERQFTKGEEPRDGLLDLTLLKGRQLKRPLRKGDHVSEDDLFEKNKVGISGMLPEGHVAVGIRVSPENIAGGFASLPHSRVDVFSTQRRGDDKTSHSMLLLEDVLVLAADTNTSRDPDNKAQLATVVTLALKPEEVAKISLAKEYGPLTLALRGFGARKLDHEVKVTLQDIVTGTKNKHDIQESGDTDQSQPLVVGPTGSVPNVPGSKEIIPIEQPKELANTRTHRVVIMQGNQQEFWEYTLDEQDRVIDCRQVGASAVGTTSGVLPRSEPAPAPKSNPKS